MFLYAVNLLTHMCTLAFALFAFQSVIPHSDTVNGSVDEQWYFKLAGESCDTQPLFHFFRYSCGLLSRHAVLFCFSNDL